MIVTYDDDLVLEIDEGQYRAVFYVSDATLTAEDVADVVHAISEFYPQDEIRGLEYLGGEWLEQSSTEHRRTCGSPERLPRGAVSGYP